MKWVSLGENHCVSRAIFPPEALGESLLPYLFQLPGKGIFLHFLTMTLPACLQSQQHNIFRSLALLPPSFTDKEGWDYIGPTRVIQAKVPI